MNRRQHLFDLIHSLSKSEKRFFKLSASIHKGDKNYLKLFDAMEKQPSYDEKAIRKRLKGEKFIQNLSYEKNYLYRLILKSLNSYHAENSVDAQLKEMLSSIQVLHKKALRDQSRLLIERARKIALRYEKHLAILEMNLIEKRIVFEEYNYAKAEKMAASFPGETSSIMDSYKMLIDHSLVQDHILLWYMKTGNPAGFRGNGCCGTDPGRSERH